MVSYILSPLLSVTEFSVCPGDWMSSFWVVGYWINELTVVILSVQSGLSSFTNNDELIDGLLVHEILVNVVLEMLDLIHMLLNEVISSNLLEWESFIIKFPGVDS